MIDMQQVPTMGTRKNYIPCLRLYSKYQPQNDVLPCRVFHIWDLYKQILHQYPGKKNDHVQEKELHCLFSFRIKYLLNEFGLQVSQFLKVLQFPKFLMHYLLGF